MKRFSNGIVLLLVMGVVLALGRAPEANAGLYDADKEVTFKEYWMPHKQFTGGCAIPGIDDKPNGNVWYTEPDTLDKCPKLMTLNIPDGMSGALKAELFVDLWRNYETKSARVRINNNPTKIYESPVGYDWSRTPWIQEIPLDELATGENTFLFWGESGKYHIHDVAIRIYYDDAHPLLPGGIDPDTTPPDAELVSIRSLDAGATALPAYAGGLLWANSNKVELTAKVTGAEYIEFHAYYDGYDDDNDGETREWHNINRNNWWPGGKLSAGEVQPPTGGTINHIGSINTDPGDVEKEYKIIWDLPHVVNQAGIRFKIKVVDGAGNVREAPGGVTPGITLVRNYPVVYYTMPDFEDFGLHMDGQRPDSALYTFPLPDDLNLGQYSKAYLLGMYWRVPRFKLNGTEVGSVRQGGDEWSLAVREFNKSLLVPGDNFIEFLYDGGTGHFIERPGPMILLHGLNSPTKDTVAPNVISRSPQPESTDINFFSSVVVRLGDAGVGVDKDSITMSVNGQPVTPSTSGPSNNLTLTYVPEQPYPAEERIRVTVHACDLLANCMATPDEYYFETEEADTTPPVISNVLVNTTNNTATVTWMTNESATSKVEWGTTTSYEKPFASDNALVAKHSLPLSGLQPDTGYNFRLTSTDFFGNTAVTGNLTFRTKREPGAILSDEFSGCALDTSVWSYINPLNDAPLSMTGAGAQISVPAGTAHDLWRQGLQAPRLMQFVTNQDFDVEVKFDNTINKRTQTMGLLVQEDTSNWLRFNFQHDGSGNNSLVVVNSANGSVNVAFSTPITVGAENYMRLNRAGDLWSVQYSTDGSNWLLGATITRTLVMNQIGPYIGNTGSNPDFVGTIDYFENLASPLTGGDTLPQLTVSQVGIGTVTRVPNKTNYQCYEEVQLTAIPGPEWGFGGWSGAISGTDPTTSIVITQTAAVVATFTNSTPYNVNVNVVSQGDGTGGTVSKDPQQATYLFGDQVTLTAVPAPGWSFAGWSGDFTGIDPVSVISVDGDMNITATFEEAEYTIETSFQADGYGEGGTITVDPLQDTYKYGDSVTLSLTLNPGWTFVGWAGEGVSGTNPTLQIIMTQDVTAIAQISQAQYDFNIDIINNGAGQNISNGVIRDPDQPTYGYGQTVTLTAAPDLGWEFGGWGGALSGMEITTMLLITQDNDISATFNQLQYELVITTDGPGSVTVEPQKDYYVYGDVVTLSPVPEKGYDFKEWSGGVTGTEAPLYLAITQDLAVEAVFEVDTTPIEIVDTGVKVFGGTVAVISWTTDVPGTSRVDYGETTQYEIGTEMKDTLVTKHTVMLTSLKPETLYRYLITSTDEFGNEVVSEEMTFSTSTGAGLASDDFSSCELSNRWTFIDPLSDASYAMGGREVSISVPATPHNIWTTGIDVPRLMQPSNDTDFTIEVKFDSTLAGPVAMQGILIQQDDNNFIRFDFYKRSPEDTTQEINIYSATFENLSPRVRANNKVPEQLKPMYMRIVREGDNWTQLYSYDGTDWTENASFSHEIVVNQVGVFAGNTPYKGETPAHTAIIDYFFNSASPIVPEDSFYKIASGVEGSGSIQFQPNKSGYYCGEEVTVTATGLPGWGFIGWGGDLSGSNPTRTITVSDHMSIIARFQQGAFFRQYMPFVQKP